MYYFNDMIQYDEDHLWSGPKGAYISVWLGDMDSSTSQREAPASIYRTEFLNLWVGNPWGVRE